jgi:uncharacterized protein
MFSEKEGQELVKLARISIKDGLMKKNTDLKKFMAFSEKLGVFVTLTENKELRGCIGFPEPVYPLNDAIVQAARAAAFGDPRFKPLKEDDFTEIEIEISVLTKPQLIRVKKPEDYLKEIKIGRDGLIIRAGLYSGLLLPQVATDHDWDVETFLRHLCMKASLSIDAWQNVSYRIYRFSAQIFHEKKEKITDSD